MIKSEQDDLVVLYSDGISEALNNAGAELGPDGLKALAEGTATQSAATFGAGLAQSLVSFRAGGVCPGRPDRNRIAGVVSPIDAVT